MTDTALKTKIDSSRLPKTLRYWFDTFSSEGENPRAAIKHAIDRCYESGDISEEQSDKYEAMYLG